MTLITFQCWYFPNQLQPRSLSPKLQTHLSNYLLDLAVAVHRHLKLHSSSFPDLLLQDPPIGWRRHHHHPPIAQARNLRSGLSFSLCIFLMSNHQSLNLPQIHLFLSILWPYCSHPNITFDLKILLKQTNKTTLTDFTTFNFTGSKSNFLPT